MHWTAPGAVFIAACIVCSAASRSVTAIEEPAPTEGGPAANNLPLCVVPAGVVSDRTRLEIRVRLENNDAAPSLQEVEYQGTFFYPSEIEFFDREVQRTSSARECRFDLVGTILSQADKHGMHVLLGLGRSGDPWLLWEFDKPDWADRNRKAIDVATRIAADLWTRYGQHASFYGWYLTHEMGDLAKSTAYYNPVADFCHRLVPEKPVLVAPADAPRISQDEVRASSVDIFAYQDAVGAGYVPGQYTYRPENRIAKLEEVFARYRSIHAGTDKHIWADLEVWEMDGHTGYANPFPASFERVKRQIEIERKYVPVLTAYAWHLYFHDPACQSDRIDPRARRLFEAYAAWKSQHNHGRE